MPEKEPVKEKQSTLLALEKRVADTEADMDRLVENSEKMADQVKDLLFFKKIRLMGSRRKKFFALLIAAAVILYWRGIWALYDLIFEYVLPEHKVTGAIVSIILGALILAGTGRLLDALVPIQLEAEIEKDLSEKSPNAGKEKAPEKTT